jgi:hypothetical protein
MLGGEPIKAQRTGFDRVSLRRANSDEAPSTSAGGAP